MSDPDPGQNQLTLRLPKPLRIYVAVFMTVWTGFVLAGVVAAVAAETVAAVIPLVMLVFGGWIGYRLFNLSVVATPQELIIRNYLATRRVAKDQVEGFRVGSPPMGSVGKAIVTLIRDDTVVSMDATARPFRWLGGERQLNRALSDLRDWLTG